MLLASWLGEKLATGTGWMILMLGIAIYFAKKFADSHPEVKDAASKAAANKAIDLIARLFKK